ncbi:MAG: hypothetical protein EBX52_06355 [Proteobacteria bacterium]|nr:hypothetical protein [Pseudomonadota bacterium]
MAMNFGFFWIVFDFAVGSKGYKMISKLLSLSIFAGTLLYPCVSPAARDFEHIEERVLPLRHSLPIYFQHRTGNLSIQGWVQDRLKVTLRMRVVADSEVEANRQFKNLELISLDTRNRYEFRVGHSPGTDLVTKMRDQAKSTVQIDLEIKAPYQSDLTLVLGDGKDLKLDQWRGGVTVEGRDNTLHFSRLDLGREFRLNCSACETEIRNSKIQGRISVGSKPVLLSDVEAPSLSIDAGNKEIRVERGIGKWGVHTVSGRLNVAGFEGQLDFQSQEGDAFLSQLKGSVDVLTRDGQVMLDFDEVRGPVHVDTEKGDIHISLVPRFEGAIDLMSLGGEVVVQFPHEEVKRSRLNRYGPESPGRVDGMIGRRQDPLIHAYSKEGGVRLISKVPALTGWCQRNSNSY